MPTFLDRYQAGERVQVWAELNSLGPSVRDKKYLVDATAVAKETMRRARHNVETLIPKLEKLGYDFLTSNKSAAGGLQGLNQAMEMLKALGQATAGNTSNPHVDKLQARSQALLDNPIFKGLLNQMETKAAAPAPKEALKNPDVFAPPEKNVAKDIKSFEKAIGGPIPLSLRAWCEIVGSVSLMGSHPVLCFRETPQNGSKALYVSPAMFSGAGGEVKLDHMRALGMKVVTELPPAEETPLADPLVIEADLSAWDGEYEEGEPRTIPLAPDDLHKADISGDAYYMEVPNAAADAPFLDWHKANFVDYLRIAFRWGGFPGWERYPERPEKELAYLAEGLLEI